MCIRDSKRPAAHLRRNWRRPSKNGRAASATAQVSIASHTCESKSQLSPHYLSPFQSFTNGIIRAISCRMNYAWLGCLLFGSILLAGTQDSEFNVNTRYTVENVVISSDGWSVDLLADRGGDSKVSSGLRKEIASLIGQKLDPAALDE